MHQKPSIFALQRGRDTVLGVVYSTRDRVNSRMLISLERKEVQPSSLDYD